MGFNLNQNEKNRKETANLTNYAKLTQVNWGLITRIFLRYRWLRAMDWL